MNYEENITAEDRREFEAMRSTKTIRLLQSYLQSRAKDALCSAVIHAEKGNALQTVASVKVYGAFSGAFDDFASQFSQIP